MSKISLPPELTAPFPVFGSKGMAVCDHPLAARAACDVMEAGGNAVDAAVALSMTLGAVCPHYTGVGGGGFALVWMPGMQEPRCLDYREVAPGNSRPDMYSGRSSMEGGLSAGVPGIVRGLALLRAEFGRLPWARLLEPAIEAAERGTQVDPNFERIAREMQPTLLRFPEVARLILNPDGSVPRVGEPFRLRDLAETYRRLAREGPDDFYLGELAHRQAEAIRETGGLLTLQDLSAYEPLWRKPIQGDYRGHQVYTVGPPSAGGIQLLQMLQVLETLPVSVESVGTVRDLHWQAEAMRLSFFERAALVADPAFVDVPVDWLLDRTRLMELASRISPERATLLALGAGLGLAARASTAAYVVASADGGVVSSTESINHWYGSMVVPPGTGFLLNNIMDDFNCNPGHSDAFGVVSSDVNQIEPGKRPTSSVAPAMVFRDGLPRIALGLAGGPRIPTAMLQILSNIVDYGMNVQQAVSAARIHHQWSPNKLYVEPQLGQPSRSTLQALGHDVEVGPCRSHGCAIVADWVNARFTGGSDFRSHGAAAIVSA